METEIFHLSKTEVYRQQVLSRVVDGLLSAAEASDRLHLSVRQIRRLLAAFVARGPGALAHGNRGRKPAVAKSDECKATVLALAGSPVYAGCNDSHLAELLAEHEGLTVSRATLRRWLRASGRPSPRKRRSPKHRFRRERTRRRGGLLQIDVSYHPWFQDRGPKAALVAAIDDATGEVVHAHFRFQEDTDGYLRLLLDVVRRHGIPGALYHDGRSTFVLIRHHTDIADQLAGHEPTIQFANAADALGIELIHARSAQAKGRIERLWETLQDRLVQELRLHEISSIEAANVFLKEFLRRYNRRFARKPADSASGFVPLPPGCDLPAICSAHFSRVVTPDNTVSVDGFALQLPPGPRGRSYRGLHVDVQRRPDDTWAIYRDATCLVHPAAPAAPRPPLQSEPTPAPAAKPKKSSAHTPAPDHPWRQQAPLAAAKRAALAARSDIITEQLR